MDLTMESIARWTLCNTLLIKGIYIRGVDIGDDFKVAVSLKGEVYTWGMCAKYGNHGQLGHGNLNKVNKPKLVKALENHTILSVSAGMDHCIAVTDIGKVFSWGNNFVNQCSPCTDEAAGDMLPVPVRVGLPEGVIVRNLSVGDCYSLVVTKEGELYSFGESPGCVTPHRPRMVQFWYPVYIKSAASGSDHPLALTEAGEVFAWSMRIRPVGNEDRE